MPQSYPHPFGDLELGTDSDIVLIALHMANVVWAAGQSSQAAIDLIDVYLRHIYSRR